MTPEQKQWLQKNESARNILVKNPRDPERFEKLLVEFAQRILKGTRVESGEAPISWKVDPSDRLEEYLQNGLPYMARVDVCKEIQEFADIVLGTPLTMHRTRKPKWAYDSRMYVGNKTLPGTGGSEWRTLEYVLESMGEADVARYKGKYSEEASYSPRKLESRYPEICKQLWWQAAKARANAGKRYVVLWGSPATKFCKYSQKSRRSDVYRSHSISEDLALDAEVFPDIKGHKWAKAEPTWSAPCMPYAYALYALRTFPSAVDAIGVSTHPDTAVLVEYWSAGGNDLPRITVEHMDCGIEALKYMAYKKLGYRPVDRHNSDSWIALRAVIKHGFSRALLAKPFLELPRRLQRLYVRYYGVPQGVPLDGFKDKFVEAAVLRAIRRGGGSSYINYVDLILADRTEEVLSSITGTGHIFMDDVPNFMAAAFEIMAAHPDEACEYLIGISPEDKNSAKILGAIIRDAQGILFSKEHRANAIAKAELRGKA